MRRIVRYIKRKIRIALSSCGNMKSYYEIAKECERVEKESNSLKQRIRYRKRILKYARKVSAKPFSLEKENENKEIWEKINSGELNERFYDEVSYIKKNNRLMLYPYRFCEQYSISEIDVFDDEYRDLCYVIHNGRKLFFPKDTHSEVAKKYYQLIMEQDFESPHRYFMGDIPVCDVFVDVGGAEGIISLDAIDKAKEIYVLECSNSWIEALNATFSDNLDKVHIIKKYAGSFNDSYSTITIDELLKKYKNKKIVVKMDIEGMEQDALRGARNVMRENECLFSCATYHTNTAYDEIKDFFKTNNYTYETTKNWMLFIYGNMTLANGKYQRIKFPYFRHGIIRGKNFE